MSNFDRNVAFLKKVRDDQDSESYNLPLYDRIRGIGKGELIQTGMRLKELPKEFKEAYSIDDLLPLLIKESFRRTILDTLYKDEPDKEKMINDAYQNFLANPNKHHPDKYDSFHYDPDDVAKFNRVLQDGDLYKTDPVTVPASTAYVDPYITKWEKLLNSNLTEAEADRIFQIMGNYPDEHAIEEDKNKAIKTLQDAVESQSRYSHSIGSDGNLILVLNSLSNKTHAVLAAQAKTAVEAMTAPKAMTAVETLRDRVKEQENEKRELDKYENAYETVFPIPTDLNTAMKILKFNGITNKDAYKAFALATHPDKQTGTMEKAVGALKFKQIDTAFKIAKANSMMKGGSRRRVRKYFKKSKSKSKSKKSKSKSKTKPKLKSNSKTKYRKQNK